MKAIMYHYVQEDREKLPFFKHLNIEDFRKQLDFFDSKHGFVTFDEWSRFAKSGVPPETPGKILLTFDDGLSCHYEYVFPELKSRGLWGLFYIATAPIRKSLILDVHKIHLLCGAFKGDVLFYSALDMIKPEMICKASQNAFEQLTYKKQVNSPGVMEFKHLLNYVVEIKCRAEIIENLAHELDFDFGMWRHYVTTRQIEEMSRQGMIIGSHTENHPVMSRLSRIEQAAELEVSFNYLSDCIGHTPETYCHPYGGFHSFSEDTIDLLAERGVAYSFSVESRDINADDWSQSAQHLPRYDCNEFPYGAVRRKRASHLRTNF